MITITLQDIGLAMIWVGVLIMAICVFIFYWFDL
jgi:hypothetical protein